MKKSNFKEPIKPDQTSQLSLLRRGLRSILDYEEIPRDGRYYLQNDAKDNHWIYTPIKILGLRNGRLYITIIETNISRPVSYEELEHIFIYDPK
jgi:hypothetical protein